MRLWLACVAIAAGCKSPASFVCAADGDCTPAGVGGVCEPNGFCSFPDEGCDSGRRFAEHAGAGLSGDCVDDGMFPDAGPDSDEPIDIVDGARRDGGGPPDAPGDARVGGCIVVEDGCLELPNEPIEVNGGMPPDYGCEPETIDLSTMAIAMTGTVRDSLGAGPRAGAGVTAFRDVLLTTSLANDTANLEGVYDLTFPAGSPDFIHWKVTHGGAVDSYVLNDILLLSDPTQDRDLIAYTAAHLDALAAGGGLDRDPDTPTYFADVYDCDGEMVEHVIGVLSTTSGVGNVLPTVVRDSVAIYLDDAYLPVPRATRTETNGDGHFYVFQAGRPMSATRYYLQAWGFLDADDEARGAAGLTLLSEFQVPWFEGAYIRVGMRSTQGPLP